jgi:UPF0176 protein
MSEIVNIAAYKFVTLDRLSERRTELLQLCERLGLRGTILLAPEGINSFLAGSREAIDEYLKTLRGRPEFADLEVKESLADRQPFNRMLVRIKKEIIAFGVPGIDPSKYSSPRVTPRELKRWLDEGRDIKLVDTRNDYEYAIGTFDNAIRLELEEFRDFPRAVAEQLPESMKKQTVVTFCTGGIRCEKAAPFMESVGFEDVYQLEGGILKYFEDCGGEHYRGECFVFDQRVGVDPGLRETETTQCYACQAVLTCEDRESPAYVAGRSCPYCHRTPAESIRALLAKRNAELVRLINPLPGSIPYENRRPLHVPERFDRMSVIEFLDALKTVSSREGWLSECAAGRVRFNGRAVDADFPLRSGMRLEHVTPEATEPAVSPDLRVLYEDDAIVVLDKPAPLPMHPCGRFNRNSLQHFVELLYPKLKVRPAHRLDANTSGLVVCSKARSVARNLQPQFEQGNVEKTYLALVRAAPVEDEFECAAAISRDPAMAGGRVIVEDGLPARTRFRVRERRADGTTLLEVRPSTGRTNQIRLHLQHLGMPIVGDPLYLADGELGRTQTLTPEDPPMCLHAFALEFTHPGTLEPTRFESPPPAWAASSERATA